MTLLCLAVIGKENEPLYLCDVSEKSDKVEESEEDDIFGFICDSKSQNDSLSLRQEFMFHAAIDRMEEIVGRQPRRRWRNPTSPGADSSSWIGMLCQMEEARIYGYITTTNIKFLAMVKDSHLVPPSREADLRALFSDIHDLYVQYTLNPFSEIGEKIISTKFDNDIKSSAAKFDAKPDPPNEAKKGEGKEEGGGKNKGP